MNDKLKKAVSSLGLKRDTSILISRGGEWLDHEFETKPEDFLDRAEHDYNLMGSSALLNSITNSKRAIRCQIAKLICCFGLDESKMNIKQKKNFLNNIGIIAPRILRKVDGPRNLLEHEYKSPSLQQVEDALDLASLFIDATNRCIRPFCSDFSIVTRDDVLPEPYSCFKNELLCNFETTEKHFIIWPQKKYFKHPDSKSLCIVDDKCIFIYHSDPVFIDLLRIAVNIEKGRDQKNVQSLMLFFDTIEKT